MILTLAVRNLTRSIPRLRPIIIVLVSSFAVLFLVNSLLSTSSRFFQQAYTQHLSGDLSISPVSNVQFTLFGSDALLVESFQQTPIIPDIDTLGAQLSASTSIATWTGLLTLPARVESTTRQGNYIVFGIDFATYSQVFPKLEIIQGQIPDQSTAGVFLQYHQHQNLGQPEIGSPILLTSSSGNSFTIREAPLLGVYRYPVSDTLLEQVVLADSTTIRSLAGYVLGNQTSLTLDSSQDAFFTSSIDDLFAAPAEDFADSFVTPQTESSLLTELEFLFATPSPEVIDARTVQEDVWHFLLLRLSPTASLPQAIRELHQLGINHELGLQVRNWRNTIGGNVLLAWYIQILFNIGIGFLILGSIIISVNALVLGILERTKEIGTMRALGANRTTVGSMILYETILVVTGSASFGLFIGVGLSYIVNLFRFTPNNQYLQILLGGQPIQITLYAEILGYHILAAFLLGLVACLYPLHKTMEIHPAKAMSA